MMRFSFRKGLRFFEGQRTWTLLRRLATGRFQMEDGDGVITAIEPDDLLTKWKTQAFTLDEKSLNASDNVFFLATPADLSVLPKRQRKLARYRYRYVRHFDRNRSYSTHSEIQKAIPQIAKAIGDASPPSSFTVFRWLKRYRVSKSIVSLIDQKRKSGRRRDAETKSILEATLSEVYLDEQERPTSVVVDALEKKFKCANQNRDDNKLVCPSRATVYRWVQALQQDILDKARLGRPGARKHRWVKGSINVKRVLERVEIDHTPLDVIIVDEDTKLPLGRPWLTLAIDTHSRMILGFYIAFHEPSSYSVLACLKHAVLPKNDWLKNFPGVKGTWPCYGLMELIAVDNGMDLHSNALKKLCLEMGIQLMFCPSRTPEFKGTIERMMRTVNTGLIHLLPGTVFSNINQRGDYPSEKLAAIDMSTLVELLTKWIVDIYHKTPHRRLGVPPLLKWQEGVATRCIELPAYPSQMEIIAGVPAKRSLFHYGLEFDGLHYNSEELQSIRRRTNETLSLDFKSYEEDTGYLHVWDPYNEVYLRVDALNQSYASGLRRNVHRMIRQSIRAKCGDNTSEQELLQAKEDIQRIIAASISHKKMAIRKKASALRAVNSESNSTVNNELLDEALKPINAITPRVLPELNAGLDDQLPTFSHTNS